MTHAQAVVFWNTEAGPATWRPTTLRVLGRDEAFLEEALAATPDLLGLASRRSGIYGPFRVFRQVSLTTPSGRGVYPDLVLLAKSGHVIVVEVKLADNPELRDRAVIAQVLDYASSFANLSDEALLALFRETSPATTWTDRIRELFPDDDKAEELAEVLRGRMRDGELNLVIACDRIPPGLPEIVRGVSTQKAFGFELDLVEIVPYVSDGKGEILFVPSTRLSTEIVARTAVNVIFEQGSPKPEIQVQTTTLDEIERNVESARQSASPTRVWRQEEVEEAFEREGTPIEQELLRFAKAHSADGEFVSSAPKRTPTFGFYIKGVRTDTGKPGKYMLFFCALGWAAINLYLTSVDLFLDATGREEFRRRLLEIAGDAVKPGAQQPMIPLPALSARLSDFEDLVLWVQSEIDKKASRSPMV